MEPKTLITSLPTVTHHDWNYITNSISALEIVDLKNLLETEYTITVDGEQKKFMKSEFEEIIRQYELIRNLSKEFPAVKEAYDKFLTVLKIHAPAL